MIRISITFFLLLICMTLSYMPAVAQSQPPNNTNALQGVKSARAVFDVNVAKADKLLLYLNVIRNTYDELVAEGLKPEFIIAFRGGTVRLLNSETWSFEDEDQAALKTARTKLKELKDIGVGLEVCSVATGLYKVDNATVLPELNLVGNTFVSLIGYQSKGYALIPIN